MRPLCTCLTDDAVVRPAGAVWPGPHPRQARLLRGDGRLRAGGVAWEHCRPGCSRWVGPNIGLCIAMQIKEIMRCCWRRCLQMMHRWSVARVRCGVFRAVVCYLTNMGRRGARTCIVMEQYGVEPQTMGRQKAVARFPVSCVLLGQVHSLRPLTFV